MMSPHIVNIAFPRGVFFQEVKWNKLHSTMPDDIMRGLVPEWASIYKDVRKILENDIDLAIVLSDMHADMPFPTTYVTNNSTFRQRLPRKS